MVIEHLSEYRNGGARVIAVGPSRASNLTGTAPSSGSTLIMRGGINMSAVLSTKISTWKKIHPRGKIAKCTGGKMEEKGTCRSAFYDES